MENNTTLQIMADAVDLFHYLYKRGALDFMMSDTKGILLRNTDFFRYFPESEIITDVNQRTASAYYAGQRFFCVLPMEVVADA